MRGWRMAGEYAREKLTALRARFGEKADALRAEQRAWEEKQAGL